MRLSGMRPFVLIVAQLARLHLLLLGKPKNQEDDAETEKPYADATWPAFSQGSTQGDASPHEQTPTPMKVPGFSFLFPLGICLLQLSSSQLHQISGRSA